MSYPIGHQFKSRGKAPRLCTVTDILSTYNAAGALVQVRYVATHEFMGQVVTDRDVCETAIKMGSVATLAAAGFEPFAPATVEG